VTGIIVAATVYIGKAIFNKGVSLYFDKGLEKYKNDLLHETEKYRTDLNRLTFEHQVKFQTLYQERAETIKQISIKLYNLQNSLKHLTSIFQGGEWYKDSEREKKAGESLQEFTDYFELNQIYFDSKICGMLRSIIEKSQKIITGMVLTKFKAKINDDMLKSGRDVSNEKYDYPGDTWNDLNNKVETDFNDARLDLANEFKQIIGIE
jgi:hypothetical protein